MIAKLPEVLLPGPLAVLGEIIAIHDTLVKNGLVTLREILIGFGLAMLVGFPIAIGIAFSRPRLRRFSLSGSASAAKRMRSSHSQPPCFQS
jgi:ABC-type nitrate/sulfonate/bicarbonate transport system permease component